MKIVNKNIEFQFLCIALILLTGCNQDAHNHPDLITGKQLFEYHCSSCHKKSGEGDFLLGVPKNKDTELGINQITHKLTEKGQTGSKMPVFENMSIGEAEKIAAYLKTL